MLNEDDIIARTTKLNNLREECFKYLQESSKGMVTHQIFFSVAKIFFEKMGPVKLGEIAYEIFGQNDKSKQDIIRLTIEKSLLKCGVVEKLYYAANDVRYLLTSYRFQKVKKIDSFRGENAEPIGVVFEIPTHSSIRIEPTNNGMPKVICSSVVPEFSLTMLLLTLGSIMMVLIFVKSLNYHS